MKTIVFFLTIICFELSSTFPFPDPLPRYYGSYEPVGVPEQRGIPQQLQSNIAHSQNSELAPTLSYQQQLAYIQQENLRRQNYENLWRIQENEKQEAARNQRLADQLKVQPRPIEQNYNIPTPVLNTVREPYSNSVPLQQPIQQNYQAPITQQYYPQQNQYVQPYLPEAPQQYQVPNKPQAVAQSSPVQQNNPYQQYQPQNQYNAQNQAYPPRVQQALASSPHKKRYLVLHPNGTVEHIDKLDSYVKEHPNYVLMNAGNYKNNDFANAKVQGPTPPNAWNTVNYPQQPVPAAPVAPNPPVAPTPPVASPAPVAPAVAAAPVPPVPTVIQEPPRSLLTAVRPVPPVAQGVPVPQATAGPVATVVPPVPVSPVDPAEPVAPVAPATAQTSTGPVRAAPVAPTALAAPVVPGANATVAPPAPVKLPTPVPSPGKTPLPPGVIPPPVIQNGTLPPGPKPTVKPPGDPTTTLRPVTAPTAQPPQEVTATANAGSGNATAVASVNTPDVPANATAGVKPAPGNVAPRKPDAVANATVKTGPKRDLDLLQVNSKTEPVVWFRTKDLDFWDKLTSGKETFDILYFFNIPREPKVNRDSKTTIHPNGTVVEEITQFIYDDEDSPPRIVKTTKVTLPENDQPKT